MDERLSRQRRRAYERAERKVSRRRHLATGAAAVGAAIAIAQSADAATFNVTNTTDGPVAAAGDLPGSLRQAIFDANAAAGADVITFQSGLTGTITLTNGDLTISDSVDIQGPGPANITVSGNNSSGVFYIYQSSSLIDVTISGLTITAGTSTSSGGGVASCGENLTLDDLLVDANHADFSGGGIQACGGSGSIVISNSTISNNTAGDGVFGFGAGIDVVGVDNLTIQNTTITGNTADSGDGGFAILAVYGTALLDNVVISNNQTIDGGAGGGSFAYLYNGVTIQGSTISGNTAGGGVAGGLLAFAAYGTISIVDSTISGNQSIAGETSGAGGLFFGYTEAVTIESSTISGNSTDGDGGGVYFYDAGTVTVRHSTVSGNTATGAGGGILAYYGDVVALSNSIVADNTSITGDVCGGGTFDVSFSLIEDPDIANINDLTPADNIFGQDPSLGALQNNGGPTETQKPASTSPAVNAGDPAFTPPPASDQRGLPRVAGGRIDMGAVELQPGMLQFAVTAASVAENVGTITITVTRTGGSDGAVSVPVSVAAGGTATAGGVDYTFAGTTLNWADGDAVDKTFDITINDDLLFEGNETLVLEFGAPTGGATIGTNTTETVTILDNETQPAITINDVSLSEGDAGTTNFQFTVTLSGPSASPISASFTTNPVSATEGTDYADATGTVNFPAMSTSQTIDVTVNGDTTFEPDEAFNVVLSAPSGATLSDDTGAGTIQNDDTQPAMSVSDVALAEGNAGTTTFQFTVMLSGESASPISASFTTNPGSATEGTDYADATGTVNFPSLSTSQTIDVSVNGDIEFEPDETFDLVLSAPSGATIADDTGLGTIQNDEGMPTLSISDVTLAEGNAGTTNFQFTVTLSAPSASPVSASFTTNPVSAAEGTDYLDATGTVNFPALSTSQTIDVTINGDTTFEPNETFNVVLSSPSGAAFADDTGVGTIQNDDAQPSLSINDVTLSEGDAGTTNFQFTVTLSGPSGTPVSASYTTNPVSASEGTDYLDATGTVSFPALSTSQTIDLTINGDTTFEPDETFNVVLSAPSGAAFSDDTGAGTIVNDDVETADVSVTKSVVEPGPYVQGQNVTFTITATNAGPGTATSVTITDTLSPQLQFVSSTPTQGSCTGTTTVTCTIGTINSGANATITLVAQITGIGTISNVATGSSANDANGVNDSGSASFTAVAPAVAAAIPALDERMLALLAAVLAALGAFTATKRS